MRSNSSVEPTLKNAKKSKVDHSYFPSAFNSDWASWNSVKSFCSVAQAFVKVVGSGNSDSGIRHVTPAT